MLLNFGAPRKPNRMITIHWTHYLFTNWPKAYSKISKSAPVTSSSCRYNNHVKDTQGHGLACHVWPRYMISKGNQVKFARFVLLAVNEEAKTWLPFFFFVQCIIKQLLDSVFVISRIIKVSVMDYQPQPSAKISQKPHLVIVYSLQWRGAPLPCNRQASHRGMVRGIEIFLVDLWYRNWKKASAWWVTWVERRLCLTLTISS